MLPLQLQRHLIPTFDGKTLATTTIVLIFPVTGEVARFKWDEWQGAKWVLLRESVGGAGALIQ